MRRLIFAYLLVSLLGCTTADAPARSSASVQAPTSAWPEVSGGDPGLDNDVHDVVGKPAPPWQVSTWFNSPPLTLSDLRGKVVVVRWFMSPSCPLCSATAPSLVLLDQRYRDR